MRILAISGSLRRDSYNTALLRAASELLPAGVTLDVYDELREIPPFDDDEVARTGPAVVRLRAAIAAADGVLIATPEYNHSIPGQLKNALDWLSRPLAGSPLKNKPTAVIGASTGIFGAVWGQAETRKVLKAIGARVLETELPVPGADRQFDANDSLSNTDLAQQLAAVLAELVAAISQRAALAAA